MRDYNGLMMGNSSLFEHLYAGVGSVKDLLVLLLLVLLIDLILYQFSYQCFKEKKSTCLLFVHDLLPNQLQHNTICLFIIQISMCYKVPRAIQNQIPGVASTIAYSTFMFSMTVIIMIQQ